MGEDSRKLIMNPMMANYLLLEGYEIVQLIANKENTDRTVFVFKNAEGLDEAMQRYSNMNSRERKELKDKYF